MDLDAIEASGRNRGLCSWFSLRSDCVNRRRGFLGGSIEID
jgi:hypothetical protein